MSVISVVILRSNATKNPNNEGKILRSLHSLTMTVVEVLYERHLIRFASLSTFPSRGRFWALQYLYSSTSPTIAICTSSNCFCSTVEGEPIMTSWAFLFMGKGIISRMESSPASSMTMRSTPGAMPA